MPRDPRINPWKGDIVRLANGVTVTVLERTIDLVTWQASNKTYSWDVTLDSWRRYCEHYREVVVKVEGEENC